MTRSTPVPRRSPDLAAEKLRRLAELFPEVVVEGRLDVEALRQLVGEDVQPAPERFGLSWTGKAAARQLALSPSTGALRPRRDESLDWEQTQNVLVRGDNLEVLKLLLDSYRGKIQIIYIDPPYNTGSDLVYPDDFRDSMRQYLRLTGQVDAGGARLVANAETSGRFHSAWLSMMYPRLKLARELLSDDGVLYVSIDDRELAHLRQLMDELFGAESYKGTIVRATGQTVGQDGGGLGNAFDYVLVYGKDPLAELAGLPLEDSDVERYQDEDARGRYALWQLRKTGSNDRRADRPNMYFPVRDPDGGEVWPSGPDGYESCWRFDREGYARLLAEDRIVWRRRPRPGGEGWWPYVKTYLEGRRKRPGPLWDDVEGSKKASGDLRALMGEAVFSNPKPLGLLRRLLQIAPTARPDALVMDFFAGSGSTGHAVWAQNLADGGARRFLLVQLPEPLDPARPEQRVAATFCADLGLPADIAALTAERLRRASQALRVEAKSSAVDLGFRVYALDASNLLPWDPHPEDLGAALERAVDPLRPGRGEDDLLTELILRLGMPLTVPVRTEAIGAHTVHVVGEGALLAVLSSLVRGADLPALVEAVAALGAGEGAVVVFRDAAFEDDACKASLIAALALRGLPDLRVL